MRLYVHVYHVYRQHLFIGSDYDNRKLRRFVKWEGVRFAFW